MFNDYIQCSIIIQYSIIMESWELAAKIVSAILEYYLAATLCKTEWNCGKVILSSLLVSMGSENETFNLEDLPTFLFSVLDEVELVW